jgi:hypothetical protein
MEPLVPHGIAQRLEKADAVGVGVESVQVVKDDRLIAAIPKLAVESKGLHVPLDVQRGNRITSACGAWRVAHGQRTPYTLALPGTVAAEQEDQAQFPSRKLRKIQIELRVGRQDDDLARQDG